MADAFPLVQVDEVLVPEQAPKAAAPETRVKNATRARSVGFFTVTIVSSGCCQNLPYRKALFEGSTGQRIDKNLRFVQNSA
jgi:hypothetical protein